MVKVNDDEKILKELEMRIRNADIISTSERNVTTRIDTVTLTADTEYLINRDNVKNIRSVEGLTFGEDYIYDLDYNDSGTYKCKITFNTAQTGDFDIQYDYGDRDKIFYSLTRQDIHLEDYPFLNIELTSSRDDQASMDGSVFEEDYLFSIYIYDKRSDEVNSYIKALKTFVYNNQKKFYYLRYIIPTSKSPLLYVPNRDNKIVFKTLEIRSPLNEETI